MVEKEINEVNLNKCVSYQISIYIIYKSLWLNVK